jgi:hypothetical protein
VYDEPVVNVWITFSYPVPSHILLYTLGVSYRAGDISTIVRFEVFTAVRMIMSFCCLCFGAV